GGEPHLLHGPVDDELQVTAQRDVGAARSAAGVSSVIAFSRSGRFKVIRAIRSSTVCSTIAMGHVPPTRDRRPAPAPGTCQPVTPMRILLRCCLLLALLAVGLAPVPPVAAQPAAITDPQPPPGALVPGGTITVSARVGAVDAVIAAAGEPQPTTVAGGVATAVLTDVAAGPLPLTV